MAFTGLHTNWMFGSYEKDRNEEIKRSENDALKNGDLSKLKYYDAVANSIAIGYGFDLLVRSNAEIDSYLTAIGLGALSASDAQLLDEARSRRNAGTATQAYLESVVSQLSLNLGSEPTAEALLNEYIRRRAESDLDAWLNGLGVNLPQSRERAALVSLAYNNPALLGSFLGAAILNDDRAEAWYQIRYQSNGGASRSLGIANRRYRESDLFGLYDTGPIDINQAKQVVQMYTLHRPNILQYEAEFLVASNIYAQLTPANGQLIAAFGLGKTFNEVFVGKDQSEFVLNGTAGADLILGEGGDDTINGFEGQDVIYGGTENDTLDGGLDADWLFGEQGFDTYNAGAGDTIRDIDGSGRIFRGGAVLNGGSRLQGETNYVGGGHTYSWSGGTLVIDGSLTVENFNNGNLQINLILVGTAGNDSIQGTNVNDILEGGAGNDTISGLGGSDVYLYSREWGKDQIQDASSGELNTIRFSSDILPTDIHAGRGDNQQLYISLRGSSDRIIASWFSPPSDSVQRVEFADGTVWGQSFLLALDYGIYLGGTAGDDSFSTSYLDRVGTTLLKDSVVTTTSSGILATMP